MRGVKSAWSCEDCTAMSKAGFLAPSMASCERCPK